MVKTALQRIIPVCLGVLILLLAILSLPQPTKSAADWQRVPVAVYDNRITEITLAHPTPITYAVVPSQTGVLPDLVIQSLSISPTTPFINIPLTVSVIIKNLNGVTVTAPFSVGFYTDPASLPRPDDAGQLRWTVNSLGVGQTALLTGTASVSLTGAHKFYARVDTTYAITETKETNNLSELLIADLMYAPLDVVLVLDRSGSTEWNPVCYGCWERKDRLPNTDPDYDPDPGFNYPSNGVIYPLGWPDGFTNTDRIRACTTAHYDADQHLPGGVQNSYTFNVADTVNLSNGHRSLIIEAELYSLNSAPVISGTQPRGRGYWAMQRGEGNYEGNASHLLPSQGYSLGNKGAHMAHHPTSTEIYDAVYGRFYTLADAQEGVAPWLGYDFRFYSGAGWAEDSSAHLWVRVHANRGFDYNFDGQPHLVGPEAQNVAYWGLVKADAAETPLPNYALPGDRTSGLVSVHNTRQTIPNVNRKPINSRDNHWHWLYLGSIDQIELDTYYRLYFFAGSPGYSLDRILITDKPTANRNNGSQNGKALGLAGIADATVASAYRAACDTCNPLYAANITNPLTQCTFHADGSYYDAPDFWLGITTPRNNALHPLFDEWEMPLRDMKEASKVFVKRLNPMADQVGFAYFSRNGISATELACLRAAQTQGVNCHTPPNPVTYTEALQTIESIYADGGTPTALGIREGLKVLGLPLPHDNPVDLDCGGTPDSSCARVGRAQRLLILLTDGQPNTTQWHRGCTSTTAPSWPVPPHKEQDAPAYRCPLQYAQLAGQHGIIVYVIGIGFGPDEAWLQEIANLGKGVAYLNVAANNLEWVFDDILSRHSFVHSF